MKKQILSLFLASSMLCNFTAQAAEYTPLDKKLEIADKVTSLLAVGIACRLTPIKSDDIRIGSYQCIQFVNFIINAKLFTKHKKKTRILSTIPATISLISTIKLITEKEILPEKDSFAANCLIGSMGATLLKNIVDGGTVAYDVYNSYKAQT